jgi:hypothetical protein
MIVANKQRQAENKGERVEGGAKKTKVESKERKKEGRRGVGGEREKNETQYREQKSKYAVHSVVVDSELSKQTVDHRVFQVRHCQPGLKQVFGCY